MCVFRSWKWTQRCTVSTSWSRCVDLSRHLHMSRLCEVTFFCAELPNSFNMFDFHWELDRVSRHPAEPESVCVVPDVQALLRHAEYHWEHHIVGSYEGNPKEHEYRSGFLLDEQTPPTSLAAVSPTCFTLFIQHTLKIPPLTNLKEFKERQRDL